ncbi:MAG: hypothetical protein AAF195_03965, partial [Pseudomonadota bacterium]
IFNKCIFKPGSSLNDSNSFTETKKFFNSTSAQTKFNKCILQKYDSSGGLEEYQNFNHRIFQSTVIAKAIDLHHARPATEEEHNPNVLTNASWVPQILADAQQAPYLVR